MFTKVSKFFENATWFKCIYFLLVLLSFNSLCALRSGMSYFSYAVALLGGFVVLFRLLNFKKYISARGIVWLVLFCGSYFLSALLTRQYGLMENIQAVIWMVVQFFIIYTYDNSAPIEQDKKEIKILGWLFLGYTFIMSAAAIVMLITDYNNYRPAGDTAVISGFLWNRLWGLYTDPNYGAVFSIISMVLSVAFYKASKRPVRVFFIVNIVFQILYITFSDSRTALVALMVTVFAATFLLLLRAKKLEKHKVPAKAVISVILALVLAVGSAVTIAVVQKTGNELKVLQYEYNAKHKGDAEDEVPDTIIGRTDSDINNDVSNRRFAIWQSGLEIFKTSPMTGITFRNYIPYAKEHLPNTYIVHNDSGDFASLHNSFVDVLVSQGALGMGILLCFIVSLLIVFFRRFFKSNDEEYRYNTFLLLMFLPVLVSMMFYSETFYMNTGGAFLFWAFLGYFMHSLNRSAPQPKLLAKITGEK